MCAKMLCMSHEEREGKTSSVARALAQNRGRPVEEPCLSVESYPQLTLRVVIVKWTLNRRVNCGGNDILVAHSVLSRRGANNHAT
jgi:hypothetical protein